MKQDEWEMPLKVVVQKAKKEVRKGMVSQKTFGVLAFSLKILTFLSHHNLNQS